MDSETSHEERKEIVKMGNEGLNASIKKIEEALQDEEAYDAFMTYKIEEMHQENIIEENRKKGKEQGKREGRKEGREEGKKEEKIQTAVRLKNMGFSIENIIKATDLAPEFIEKL